MAEEMDGAARRKQEELSKLPDNELMALYLQLFERQCEPKEGVGLYLPGSPAEKRAHDETVMLVAAHREVHRRSLKDCRFWHRWFRRGGRHRCRRWLELSKQIERMGAESLQREGLLP